MVSISIPSTNELLSYKPDATRTNVCPFVLGCIYRQNQYRYVTPPKFMRSGFNTEQEMPKSRVYFQVYT